ncbi:hypothetical protein F4861DRAFT_537097 [Xylaria intraflava]|nr:hypothetical protein F4861DRAFT_537097 [Xylaria intraflava]
MGRTTKPTITREQRATRGRDKAAQSLHDLELKHQKNASETELLLKDEDARRLRLRILLLRDENTSLQNQVDLNHSANAKLTTQCDNLGVQIEAKIALVRSQEEQLRKQEREYSNLKAELQTMNDVSENSANVLSEKLALSRELANIKPEIDHLRSQVNHQQTILSEKLALERQVSTLEVELANEKKATKRAIKNRESNDRVEDELRKKLRETEKKLTAETAERERLEDQLEQRIRTHAIALQDQNSTRELEADLRKKLQEAQRELREQQAENERLDEELQNAQRGSKKSRKTTTDDQIEAELLAQLEESEKKLRTLAEESTRHHEQHQAAITELEGRNEQLEEKLEKMRTKFRESQEELTKSQTELRKLQKQQAQPSKSEDTTKPTVKTQASRKRKALETTGDFTSIDIPTPSADDATKARRIMKKPVFEPTIVGEKSAFSITPFLNRSKGMSMNEDASNEDDDVLEDSMLGPQSEPSELTASRASEPSTIMPAVNEPADTALPDDEPKVVPKPRGKSKKILGEATSAKKNALSQKVAKKALKSKSNLDKVTEVAEPETHETSTEAEDRQPEEKKASVKFDLAPQDESNAPGVNEEPPKKKKRKVLGSTKTLFDEDDGDGETPTAGKPAKTQPGAKKSKAPLGIRRNAFAGAATFSPLKRDRRGVAASFLA